jgi:Phage head-tail joining protein
MGIGAYRHQVTFDDPGGPLDPPVWDCALEPASTVADGQLALFVRGRYHPGIRLETQIIFEGRTLQVQSISDRDERHIELQLLCVEVVARGR